MTFVKFCGITNYEDAKLSLDLGVGALGFNFCKASARYINPIDAKTIVRRLPPNAWFVGVFVNSTRAEIDEIARTVSLDTIQLHGDESEDFCKSWNELRVIKALRLGTEGATVEDCKRYSKVSECLLIDHYSSKTETGLLEYGGTGKEINADILAAIPRDIYEKTFLAGGLTPENVEAKIKKYRPFAVDVASGIEISPGRKSLVKMTAFIEALSL